MEARWNGNFNASTLLSNAYQQPSFQVTPGERLPESPTLNWSASLRYEHAVGSSWRAFGQFDASHKGGIWNSLKLDARSFQAPYTLANLRAGLTRPDGALSIEAFVTNIANTRGVVFFNSTGYDYYPGVSTPEIDTPPRTIGLRLHMGWDRKR